MGIIVRVKKFGVSFLAFKTALFVLLRKIFFLRVYFSIKNMRVARVDEKK